MSQFAARATLIGLGLALYVVPGFFSWSWWLLWPGAVIGAVLLVLLFIGLVKLLERAGWS